MISSRQRGMFQNKRIIGNALNVIKIITENERRTKRKSIYLNRGMWQGSKVSPTRRERRQCTNSAFNGS